jgi:hypothetical protein
LERHIRPYRNGRDLTARARDVLVIDLFGLEEAEVRRRFPEVYQHLLLTVKVDRQKQFDKSPTKDAAGYLERWWVMGKPRSELRPALKALERYIATVETMRHRIFLFLPNTILADNKIVCIATEDASLLGVLSSRFSVSWSIVSGGWLGAGNDSVYVKSAVFDPFPFPDPTPDQRDRIGDIAEELDSTRKEVLAEHPDLTLTTLYNLREKLVKGEAFSPREEDQRMRGRVDIIAELHDRLDAAVAQAYRWPADLSDEEIVARLVALNAERAAEERRGIVRWLRPDYQLKKAGVVSIEQQGEATQIEAVLPTAHAAKPAVPADPIALTAAVLADLRGGNALTIAEIAKRYRKSKTSTARIQATLEALVRLGYVSLEPAGYRLRKAA